MTERASGGGRRGRVRVLFVANRCYPYAGGVETHMDEVGRRLVRADIDLTILSTDPTGRLPRRAHHEGMDLIRVKAWPREGDYFFAPGLYGPISTGGWDIVHCQGYQSLVAPVAMLAARRVGIPYVVSFHSAGSSYPIRNMIRPLQLALLRPLVARAVRLIAVSRHEIDFFSRRMRIPRERFRLIRNGADLPTLEEAAGVEDGPPVIVSVGRLERYKGHQRAIAALPSVLRHHPDARLLILGTGPYESTLRRIARELGVADRVEIGSVPPDDRLGMARRLSRAALVVLLSDYEAHPVAAIEALALRRPVLFADNSGMSELAGQGLARAVALDRGTGAIAAAMVGMLGPGTGGAGSHEVAPAVFQTWDDCAADILALYREIALEGPCGS